MVYASKQTIACLKETFAENIPNAEYKVFKEWDDFLVLSREIKHDDNLIIVMSRKNYPSYHNKMARIPAYLNRYFQKNSYILIYPVQTGIADDIGEDTALQPLKTSILSVENIRKILGKVKLGRRR